MNWDNDGGAGRSRKVKVISQRQLLETEQHVGGEERRGEERRGEERRGEERRGEERRGAHRRLRTNTGLGSNVDNYTESVKVN